MENKRLRFECVREIIRVYIYTVRDFEEANRNYEARVEKEAKQFMKMR